MKTLLVVALLVLAGCQTTGGSFCDLEKPDRLSQSSIDALTDEEVAKMVARLRKGEKFCGWKP